MNAHQRVVHLLFGCAVAICALTLLAHCAAAQQGVCTNDGNCTEAGQRCSNKYEDKKYPSIFMNRYSFISNLYPLLRFLFDIYFALVEAVFELYNWFQPVQTVSWCCYNKLLEIPAHKAAKMIREKKLKSSDLVAAYVARAKEVNDTCNSVAHQLYEAAMKEAAAVDASIGNMTNAQLSNLATTQPLLGVPFTSKDNLMTKGYVAIDGFFWEKEHGTPATRDAQVVASMRQAGAILIAITTCPGFAWSCDYSAYGMVFNPHDTRRQTGGSSAGQGALVASAGSLCGLGNDIGGSIRIPSNMNGIFGLKPTHGQPGNQSRVVNIDGMVPVEAMLYPPAAAMLTNGPLCRYASDFPIVLAVLAQKDVGTYNLNLDFSKDVRIFYMEDLNILISQSLQPEPRGAVRTVKNYFEKAYNLSVQKVEFPLMSHMYELYGYAPWTEGVMTTGQLSDMFFDVMAGGSNSTIFQFESEVMKTFVVPKDEAEKRFLKKKREKLHQQIVSLLGKNGVLVTPVWPTVAPYHHTEPFTTFNLDYTMLFNILGYPALTVPVSKSPTTNMPLGVQLVGAPFTESLLIAVAKELEDGLGGWLVPGDKPNAGEQPSCTCPY